MQYSMLQRASHPDPRVRSQHPSLSPAPRGVFSPPMGRTISSSPDPNQRLANYFQTPVEPFPVQDMCHVPEGIEGTLGASGLRMNIGLRGNFDVAMLAPSPPSAMQRLVSPDDLQHHNHNHHNHHHQQHQQQQQHREQEQQQQQQDHLLPSLESDDVSTSSSYASPYEDPDGMAYNGMNLLHPHHAYAQPLPSGEVPGDSGWPSRHTPVLYDAQHLPMGGPTPGCDYGSGAASLQQLEYGSALDDPAVKQEEASSVDGEYQEDDDDDDHSSNGRSSSESETSKTSKTRRRRLTPADKCRVRCHLCKAAFSRTFNWKTHMLTHQDNRPRPFSCDKPGCDKKFYRQTDLKRHDSSVHEKSKSHRCGFCDKGFPRKDSLSRHQIDGCLRRLKVRGRAKGAGRGRKRATASTSTSPQSAMQPLPAQHHQNVIECMPSELALRLAHGQDMSGSPAAFGHGEWHQ